MDKVYTVKIYCGYDRHLGDYYSVLTFSDGISAKNYALNWIKRCRPGKHFETVAEDNSVILHNNSDDGTINIVVSKIMLHNETVLEGV